MVFLLFFKARGDFHVTFAHIVSLFLVERYAGAMTYSALTTSSLLLSLSDSHFIRLFKHPFVPISDNILPLIFNANRYEMASWLRCFSPGEVLLFFLAVSGGILCLYSKPPRYKRGLSLTGLLLFCCVPLRLYALPVGTFLKERSSFSNRSVLNEHARFRFHASNRDNSAHTVLLLIGETHRYEAFWDAFPAKKFPHLISFQNMISLYPNTIPSLRLLLSRKKFGYASPYFHEKSIFSLFHEAGYATYFLSYLPKDDGTHAFLAKDAGHYINYASDKAPDDKDLFPYLEKILKDKSKKLIVIKMIGVHFHFEDRYPSEYDLRRPSFRSRKDLKTRPENKEALLNTYKNAMDYSVSLVARAAEEINRLSEPAFMLFSSDHGFCIFDREQYGFPDCQEGYHIPYFIMTNASYTGASSKLENLRRKSRLPLTQEYTFETAASLAGIHYPSADPRYDLTAGDNPALGLKRPVKTFSVVPVYYEDL
jgi:glucan phosphoethanolaminetransferase (alkaline phosphatase superfamily)